MNDIVMEKAEPWSYAVGFAGKGFVFLTIAFCLVAAYLMATRKHETVAKRLFAFGALGFVGAFVCLLVLFLTHQFQFEYVFRQSARDHELQYLIAAVWSGQQGSFLLWGLMASIAGVIAARGAGEYRRWFTVVYGLFLAGLGGILAYESPFHLLKIQGIENPVPPDGMGLVPSLLNYWIVIHPPTIFVGFGVLTVLFAYAFAAVLQRNVVSWIPMVRPWALVALAVLGLGLCMGGFWAYETLGWGGFWMWDPVENTSFVPWCAVVAFVHGMFVQQARKKWFLTNVVFGALPFILFCYGTLLTRSGWLGDTSVHGFATMNPTALILLISLSSVSLVAFVITLFKRWPAIAGMLKEYGSAPSPFLGRETFYGIGVWLVSAFGVVTALGMSYPLILRIMGRAPAVIEEQLYHKVLAWIFPPLMIAMAIAPFLSWKGLSFREMFSRITNSLAVSIGIVGVILLWMKSPGFHAPERDEIVHFFDIGVIDLGFWRTKHLAAFAPVVTWVLILTGLCLFVAVASFWRMMESLKKSKQTVGAMLAHFGIALALLGLVFSRGFEKKVQVLLHESEDPTAFGYTLVAQEQTSQFSDRNNKIPVVLTSSKEEITARPGLYYYPGNEGEPQPMVWPGIVNRWLYDYYFTIYEPVFDATGMTSFELSDDPIKNPDTKAHRDVVLLYTGYAVEGSVAEDGESKLTAKFTAVTDEGAYDLEPSIKVSLEGPSEPVPARIGDRYWLTLHAMDPETHAVQVTLEYIQPAYPMEVFFKPLTLFVWIGVGIMTLGGLLSAAVRRKERLANNNGPEAATEV